jgi:hypothetical protein
LENIFTVYGLDFSDAKHSINLETFNTIEKWHSNIYQGNPDWLENGGDKIIAGLSIFGSTYAINYFSNKSFSLGNIFRKSGGSSKTGGICFTGETLVKTEDGRKQIQDIKVGDKVYSENVETGEKGYKTVKRIFINDAYTLLYISVNDTEIKTTFPHPFYVIGKGWVEAKDLKVGDILKLANAEITEVKALSVEKLKTPVKVFNFEVEDWHTYYVSGYDILVHNTGSNPCAQLPDNAVVVRGGESKAGDLIKNQAKGGDGTLSANGGVGLSEAELSNCLPQNKISVTTVGELRAKGYNVVSSPTANNPNHVSIITPRGQVLTDVEAANLQSAFNVKPNPSK